MGNREQRLERLERPEAPEGASIIAVYGGETNGEARQKHLAQQPDHENAEMEIYVNTNLTQKKLNQ